MAVKAAATKFIELSIKEADNNVKLIVLDRVDQLRQRNEGVLDDLTMEILRVLSSTDIDVRRKALDLALAMLSSKNVEEVVMLLKKELSKSLDEQYEKVCCDITIYTLRGLKALRTTSTGSCSYIRYINAPSSFQKSQLRLLSYSWILSPNSMPALLLM